jgi:LytS/YehU family sensor histidine kinase
VQHREKILVLQNKAQLLEKEKTLVMYESLKQQLNPHFLFNSLTSLSSLIQQDPKIAKRFLDQMSKIYRYILKNRDSELVLLSEDIKLAEVYTQLQQTRFQKGLQLTINVNEKDQQLKIVPVTLQNLIENAIKHNVIDFDTPLVIEIFTEDDYLVVRNILQRKNFVETSNRQGLANMQSLYHYLNGKPVIIQEDEKYFTVKIPLI